MSEIKCDMKKMDNKFQLFCKLISKHRTETKGYLIKINHIFMCI